MSYALGSQVVQEGDGNAANVFIGGYNSDYTRGSYGVLQSGNHLTAVFALCIGVAAGPARADGNRASVLQISPPGSSNGNVLVLDQSAATNSTLAGVPLSGGLILGTQAFAFARLDGDGGLTPANGNRAAIVASSAALANVTQIGLGNAATLSLDSNASALISQNGNSNLVSNLSVGSGGDAVVTQTGNYNSTGAITVPPGVALNYTQTGNGLGPVGSTGVQVIYSAAPAAITITQQGW